MTPRVLIAGVGNIFFGDDGYGVEVVRRLSECTLPEGAKVADFGIRGMHLAFEIASGYDLVILIDAIGRGGAPGTLYIIEPDRMQRNAAIPDAHSMELQNVLSLVEQLGGTAARILVVGCEPDTTQEGIGLSTAAEHTVGETVTLVSNLVRRHARRITKTLAATEAIP